MDESTAAELTLLRETRSDIPEPSIAELEAMYAPLEKRMSRAKPRAQRRLVPIAAIAAAAIAVTAVGQTTVVVQSAQASTVLGEAADNTIHAIDPVVGPGQYLKVETLAHWTSITDDHRWMHPEIIDVYKPYDTGEDWTLVRTSGKPDSFSDAASKTAALKSWAIQKNDPDLTEVIHSKDGSFYGDPWQSIDVATVPRDPKALYAWFDARYNGGSNSRAEDDWGNMVQFLVAGSVPADLRAAVYKALALIPGVSVGDREATLDGRTGVAIGRTELLRGGQRQEIIIDPETGLLIGQREIMTLSLFGYHAGEVTGSTSVTTSVVDSAP